MVWCGARARSAALPRPAATAAGSLAAVLLHCRFWVGERPYVVLSCPTVLLATFALHVFYIICTLCTFSPGCVFMQQPPCRAGVQATRTQSSECTCGG